MRNTDEVGLHRPPSDIMANSTKRLQPRGCKHLQKDLVAEGICTLAIVMRIRNVHGAATLSLPSRKMSVHGAVGELIICNFRRYASMRLTEEQIDQRVMLDYKRFP